MKRHWFPLAMLAAFALPLCWAKSATIPAGSLVHVRITEDLSSEQAQPGDTFHGVLENPIEADGKTIYPRGAAVTGRVRTVESSGRLHHPGVLELELIRV